MLVAADEQRLYVGGAAGLLDEARAEELEACRGLLEVLEQRAALLELLGEALDPTPAVRARRRRARAPALRGRLARRRDLRPGNRTLGAVSLLGPLRMDYEKAIRSVRGAAHELSRFVEEIYDDD